jgi:serine/threonine protein kinase
MTTQREKIGKYILEKELGRGAFGVVYKAIDSTDNKVYAVKKLQKKGFMNSKMKILLDTEISIMSEITHPNILHLFEYLQSDESYYLVIQFCNQGDFDHYLSMNKKTHLEENEAVGFLKQIMNGFTELRKRQILHRDFKLENLFMNDGVLIIGDFGLAKKGAEITSTKLGTPLTMAPELMFGEDNISYNSKADLWSIGCVYYQMLFGEPPFFALSIGELKADIKNKTSKGLTFKYAVSADSKDLINKLLTFDPVKRIEWRDFFNHPLFTKVDTQKAVDFKDIFSAIKNMAFQNDLVDKEFQNNKNIVPSQPKGNLLNVEDLLNHKSLIQPKLVSENSFSPSDFFSMQQNIDLENLKKAYIHENNKILFLDFTLQKILRLLSDPYYKTLYSPLIDIGLLIARKSLVLNACIVNHLVNHSNFLQLNQNAFSVFANSIHENEILQIFQSERLNLNKIFQNFVQIQQAYQINLTFPQVVFNPAADLGNLDQNLQYIYGCLKNYSLQLPDNTLLNSKVELINILVCVVNSIYSQSNFPFVPNQQFPDFKFNWGEFYNKISKHSYEDMLNLI